jgi:HK97 family phage major capsid protein
MTKVQLIKSLIEKENDAAKLAVLNGELIEAIREEEREKLKVEMAQKALVADQKGLEDARVKAEAETKAKAVVQPAGTAAVKVLDTDNYLGFNLKAMKRNFLDNPKVHGAMRARALADPESCERLMKWWAGVMDKGIKATPDQIQKAAQVEGTAGLGGYLTPTEEKFTVLSYVRDVSLAMRLCTHVPMISDVQTLPRELTKVTTAFTAEATDATETSTTFDLVTLTAKRLDAYTKTSNELLQDQAAPGGIAGILASQFIEAVGQKLDSVVFTGAGDPMSGVFKSAGTSVTFASGSTNFSALIEGNLRTAIRSIRTNRLRNARWFSHRIPSWDYIYGLKDTSGLPLLKQDGIQGPAAHTVWGYPLEMPEEAPYTSAPSTGFIVFGDLSGVMIGDRLTNIQLFVNPYSFARSNMTEFLLFTRWGFAQALPELYCRICTPAS